MPFQHPFPFFSCNSLYFSLGSTSPLSVHRSRGLYPRLQECALCSNMRLRPDQLSHFFLLVTVIGRVIGSTKAVVIILNLDCWETTEKNPPFLLSNLRRVWGCSCCNDLARHYLKGPEKDLLLPFKPQTSLQFRQKGLVLNYALHLTIISLRYPLVWNCFLVFP